ncbi:hypothetical protein M758_UG104000 [Ceratodon purpureus]|nr:hypothetical protein M758_UG104000 [Ceratodon purpureus]
MGVVMSSSTFSLCFFIAFKCAGGEHLDVVSVGVFGDLRLFYAGYDFLGIPKVRQLWI